MIRLAAAFALALAAPAAATPAQQPGPEPLGPAASVKCGARVEGYSANAAGGRADYAVTLANIAAGPVAFRLWFTYPGVEERATAALVVLSAGERGVRRLGRQAPGTAPLAAAELFRYARISCIQG